MSAEVGEEQPLDVRNDAEDESSGLDKDFVVSFDSLTVHVPGSGWKCCTCLDSPLKTFGQEFLGMSVQERSSFYAMDRISGYVRAGEICLVLGQNSSAKSTLLRALCGRLNEGDEMHGTVMLNGVPLGKSSQGWRRMAAYVSASDTTHSPVLTVYETFQFAAKCTSAKDATEEDVEKRVRRALSVLGLSHVADTVVGDDNLRGVSGGQKRRVTVGEMLINRHSKFLCLDNITDGLASTDSFTLIENISKLCKRDGVGAVITLLQPSDEIVNLFDKLLVLSSTGEMSYFGPVDRPLLRSIFIGDEDETQDDTGTISDLVMSQNMQGSGGSKEAEAKKRFVSSKAHADLTSALGEIRACAPSPSERNINDYLPDEKYQRSRFYQFCIIGQRRIKLIIRNAMTYSRVVIGMMFGIIVGSLFSALNQDIIGALGRTGYMFLNCFLVLMLSAAVTLPEGFRQRPTLFKHRTAEFYSGRVAYIAQVLLDIPLSVLEATLLSSIGYFWVRMNPGANHFFYFLGVLIGLECAGQAFGRLLCAFTRTQVSANSASSLYILLCGTVSGFMPSYEQISWVLRWLSWLTPVSYAFEGLMINEFEGRTMFGVVITDENGKNGIGEIEGSAWLQSSSIPRVQWGSNTAIKLFDLGMLFVFALVFDLLGMYYSEHTREWFFNQIRRPQAKVRRKKIESEGSNGKSGANEGEDLEKSGVQDGPKSLAVRNLTYTVSLGTKKRCTVNSILGPCLVSCMGKKLEENDENEAKELTLLHGITARFTQGRMVSLMGQSGAGKTTLMDVIAGYKTGGKIGGDILVDGVPKEDALWKKISGYAEQNDVFNPYLSVLETLQFTAHCRLPPTTDKNAVIANVVNLMDLNEYTDMVVGREREGEGLPKHARKRLTIATQLVTQPKILFLDEPTSGLGVNAAALVIGAIRRSTDALGLITLVTIHQPSRTMFETFDDLLLLAKGGRVAYLGPLGPKSETLFNYFGTLSKTEPPTSSNPADFALSVVDDIGGDAAVAAFKETTECATVDADIDADVNESSKETAHTWASLVGGPALSFFTELRLLTKRHLLSEWRNPSYSFMRINVSIWACLFLGVLFFGIKNDVQGAIFSIAAIFFLVFVLVIPMQAAVVPLIEDRAVLYREAVSGTYSRVTYCLGQLLADIPFHILNTFLMFICIYFLVGFREGGEYIGYFLLMLFMSNWVVMSLGQLFALASPNEETANGLAGLSVILSVLLMGFLITVSAMPGGWVWAYWANLFHYILQGLVTNQVSGQVYNINVTGLIPDLPAPPALPDLFGPDDPTTTVAPSNEISIFSDQPRNESRSAILFGTGTNPEDDQVAAQGSNLMGLAVQVEGKNPINNFLALSDFVGCLVTNNCLEDPIERNLVTCTVFNFPRAPVCKQEFEAVTEAVDVGEIAGCFVDSAVGQITDAIPFAQSENENAARGVPGSFSLDVFGDMTGQQQLDLVLCLLGVLFPVSEQAKNIVSKIFDGLYDVVMIVLDIIENGLNIPGNLILFYFGWSKFENGDFVAPFKWHYCMTSVAVFLVSIEILKIVAARFVVWTKR